MTFRFVEFAAAADTLRADVLAGLARMHKVIPPKYFYDDAGSRLFETICTQPEYALCRTEHALMQRYLPEIAKATGTIDCVIEPGAGECAKIRALVAALHPAAVVVLDIAGAQLAAAAKALADDHPDLAVTALGMDFIALLESAAAYCDAPRRLMYYPGSSIGNFSPDEAALLLARYRTLAGKAGQLLIGFELKKDPQALHRAYNDAAGVTAAFNLNLLTRLNRELGADFTCEQFAHYAFYNPQQGRIEMHLVSLDEQTVTLCGERFRFALGESLHTENSYKYRADEFAAVAAQAGWRLRRTWQLDGFAVQLFDQTPVSQP
jgi:dimethylhistidine N-methyltransferase